ncbi:MAG TPA: helicase-associated domain-containing protein, partial [Dermatophilaceae bacterium]|nr:helicase-associated domain-containing protein [Dermatophilaceae bacterium]
AMLPPPVEQVVLQADLTAVAPGRAEGGLARLLRLLTDIESRGAASVHRFTPASIRRGLDAGMAADDILRALRQASRTPLPQPLEYLVGDVARTHGLTRVGGVAAYLRSDDVAGLDAVLADRRLQPLRLRRIAPTVLVSPLDPSTVVQLLRRHGLAPVAEGEDGRVVLPARQGSRTPPRPSPPARTSRLDQQRLSELVARLREGEAARDRASAAEAAQPGPRLPSTDPAVTLSVLREAAADQTRVWLGHADREGEQSRVLFQPRRVIGGRAYGTVEGSEIERAFSVHRITGVLPA